MTPEQYKIMETTILLLDKGEKHILFGNLMPYLNKAKEIVKIVNRK